MSNNNNFNIKLYKKIIIKINRKFFYLIAAVNNYIEIFIFEKDYLLI